MAQINKQAEGQVEIKCNADKMFDLWARNTSLVSKICPNRFPKIELNEGDNYHTIGAVHSVTYVTPVDGKHEYVKKVLEEIDEKKRSFTYKLTEGHVMDKYYKTMREKIEITPKGENCSIFKWTIFDYENKCEDAPHPQLYIDFLLLEGVKETDRHLCSA